MTDFLSLLQSSTPLLADGAMGTLLHARGVEHTHCFDELNLTDPAKVAEIHRQYIAAGAQIILTNTFGANRYKLHKHGLEGKLTEINRTGVEIARRAVAESGKAVWVAGDVGPLGVRIAPYGRVQPLEAREAFLEQVRALAAAGVDLLVIETMTDLYETVEAIAAAKTFENLPVVATMTFTRDDRTLLGDDPAKVASTLTQAGADVIGVNCSGGPAQLLRILRQMRRAAPEARFWVKPNAGWPEHVGGRVMYAAAPEYFRDYALEFWKAGASVIGGCCGTTPEHIAAMRKSLDATPAMTLEPVSITTAPLTETEPAESPSELAQKLAAGKFIFAVEMDPPRGLATQKLVAAASLLKESGADVIDVADSPMARMRMSAWAVCDVIQRQVGMETTLHFPTRGRNLLRVQGDLLAAHALGIRNVFVVMGDPTSIGDYPEAADNYDLVPSGLVKLIKQGFNLGLDHSGTSIGQPTSFFVGSALNLCPPDPESEIKNLKRKLKAGADFFLTQPIYDSEKAKAFLERFAEANGAPLDKPVLVGILPLVSVRHANFLQNEVPGIVIPDETMQRIQQAGETASREGVQIAIELIEQIKSWGQGVYLMPQFHRYDLVAEIIEATKG
ncbi:MAG: bifunctional homocysteine S-methyltransferase/methylenetetrahydrofolate reductase [Anaerolineae bacterium]|nr:MAG: bifunctional homocysteine S-methyltransferase/methylenetetrahydrofolate reductase [Anaerolineae bacterium]